MEEHQSTQSVEDIDLVHLSHFQKQLPMLLFGQIVAAIAVAVLISSHLNEQTVIAWLSAFSVLAAIHTAMYFYQKSHPNTVENRSNRVFWHVVTVAGTALLWGGLASTLLDGSQKIESLIFIMVLLGLLANAVGATSNLKPAFFVFSTLTILPPVVKFFSLGQAEYTFIGLLLLFFLLVVSKIEKRVHSSLTESIKLRIRNNKLIENLTQETRRAKESQHKAEQSLLVIESAKCHFLAAASHDLRQPLHALRLLSSTLESTVLDPQQSHLVNNISSSVISLEGILNSLLDLSKLDSGTQTVDRSTASLFNIFSNLHRNYAPLAAEKNIAFTVEGNDMVVNTDMILLERLLSNLISNAVRYTHEGKIEISTQASKICCFIEVRDTGVGIAEENQQRIFDEFVQLDNPERDRSKGIGLGLSIVKRTADILELPLSIDSTLGEGTTFSLAVPLGEYDEINMIDIPPQISEQDLDGMHVLVIEDEISVRVALEGLLASWGCIAIIVGDCDEAVQVMQEVTIKPDVIIADLRLRDNETGIDAIERINELFGSTCPAVIMTGEIDPKTLRNLQSTPYSILHKPCDPEILFNHMTKIYLNNKSSHNADIENTSSLEMFDNLV